MLEALLASIAVVALAEIGDKTMLLAIVLAARLRAPWAIIGGIFAATIANHALAALLGSEVAGVLEAQWFRIAIALGFIAMAAWTLVPDKLDDDDGDSAVRSSGGAFERLTSIHPTSASDSSQRATCQAGHAPAPHQHPYSINNPKVGPRSGYKRRPGQAIPE